MAKKLKKAKTGMNPKVKFTLGSLFKGIISNQACIDGSKDSPWWVAAILLVFSVILPLLPNFVRLGQVPGSSFISSYNYNFDTQLSSFVYNKFQVGEEFIVEKNVLHYYDGDVEKEFVTPTEAYFTNYEDEFRYHDDASHQVGLRVFIWNNENVSKNVKYLLNQEFIVGTEDPATGAEGEKTYIPNLLVITQKTFAVSLYKAKTTTSAQTSLGGFDWTHTSNKVGLIERLMGAAKDDTTGVLDTEASFINTYRESVLKEFKKICNEAYLNQRTTAMWTTTGIYGAIYAGVVLFLGLMVFVLTRSKDNPYKYLNVWHCQKISWWAAFTPAVLGAILSLMFGTNAIGQMAFILLISVRVMWLSMKQLRPSYVQ